MIVNGARRKMVVLTVSLLLVSSVGVTSVVSAAGESELVVTPATSTVTTGETTTVDVVVESVNGGVGAAEMRVVVDNPDVASIDDVTIGGEPGLTNVTSPDNGSWVDVAYATADTDDSGSVTVLTVTVEGKADGTTALSILPRADTDAVVVYDERGEGYDLSGVSDATITVRDTSTSDGGNDDGDDNNDGDEDSPESTETPSQSTVTTTIPTSTQTATDEGGVEQSPTETQSPTATDDAADNGENETTQTSSPGFGAVLVIVSLAIATLLLARRN